MNKPYIAAILSVTSLAFGIESAAQNMSRQECKSAEETGNPCADNARDVCMTEAMKHYDK